MSWTFIAYADSTTAATIANEILNGLNSLNAAQAATAKTPLSDHASPGNAHGALIYNSSMTTVPAYNLTGAWQNKVWTFGSDSDYNNYYQKVADILNGVTAEALSPTQAAYAHFSMADYKESSSAAATMVLFWQNP